MCNDRKARVLVIDGGGRGHAIAWCLANSTRVGKIYVAPGNGGTANLRDTENVPIKTSDIPALLSFAMRNNIDLTVVGPEDPLTMGIVDTFKEKGLKIFGPTRDASQLEASKEKAKYLMRNCWVPTAEFETFNNYNYQEALRYVEEHGVPIVIKASGLALGKGAYVCQTIEEARKALGKIMVERTHGEAGKEVVIEDYLEGPEVSIHAICDGQTAKLLLPSQDHKRALDDDKGGNTGGMGAYAPVPWAMRGFMDIVDEKIVKPTLHGLINSGTSFTGLLYPGLMVTKDGPKVLEFNVRFGDPETQPLMKLLRTDFYSIMEACINGDLKDLKIQWHPGFAVCVVLASGGYPGEYKKGKLITGIEDAEKIPGVTVFHAGTELRDGKYYTSGGRVLGVTATGKTLKEAIDSAYGGVALIRFEGMHYRHDIGAKALGR